MEEETDTRVGQLTSEVRQSSVDFARLTSRYTRLGSGLVFGCDIGQDLGVDDHDVLYASAEVSGGPQSSGVQVWVAVQNGSLARTQSCHWRGGGRKLDVPTLNLMLGCRHTQYISMFMPVSYTHLTLPTICSV